MSWSGTTSRAGGGGRWAWRELPALRFLEGRESPAVPPAVHVPVVPD